MSSVTELAETWRQEVLSGLCSKCGDKPVCCTLNIFDLTEEQLRLIFNLGEEEETPLNALGFPLFERNKDGAYSTKFSSRDACPQLSRGRCNIYDNPLRPMTCSQFPLFIDEKEKTLTLHNICPATDLKYTAELCLNAMELGYGIRDLFGMFGGGVPIQEIHRAIREREFEERVEARAS